jgi:hypothetical protein
MKLVCINIDTSDEFFTGIKLTYGKIYDIFEKNPGNINASFLSSMVYYILTDDNGERMVINDTSRFFTVDEFRELQIWKITR